MEVLSGQILQKAKRSKRDMRLVIFGLLYTLALATYSQSFGLLKPTEGYYFFLDAKPVDKYSEIASIELPYFESAENATSANMSLTEILEFLADSANISYPSSFKKAFILNDVGVNFLVEGKASDQHFIVEYEYDTKCPKAILIELETVGDTIRSIPTSYNGVDIYMESVPHQSYIIIKELEIKGKNNWGLHYNKMREGIIQKLKKQDVEYDAISIKGVTFPQFNNQTKIQLIQYTK